MYYIFSCVPPLYVYFCLSVLSVLFRPPLFLHFAILPACVSFIPPPLFVRFICSQEKTTFGRRRPSVEDDLRWKTTFGGRRPSVEDDLRWKTTFGGRRPSGRRPSVDPCMLPSPLCGIFSKGAKMSLTLKYFFELSSHSSSKTLRVSPHISPPVLCCSLLENIILDMH